MQVERMLWRARRKRLAREVPRKFRWQHPIGWRIADFACPTRKLVIEFDGGQHGGEVSDDVVRSAEFAQHGYRVIPFQYNAVPDNLEGVLETIRREMENPPPHPASPPRGAERS